MSSTRTVIPKSLRRMMIAVSCVGVAVPLALAPVAADAHAQPRLAARIINVSVSCMDSGRICIAEGRVRVWNRRAAGTGAIVICVGVDVHTPRHESTSLEPPLPGGQAVIKLRPGRSGVATYRTVFDRAAGTPGHVHVTHVHKHLVHGAGGAQC